MAILKNEDGKELILLCDCECDEGIRVRRDADEETYCYQTYLSGNWYREQAGLLCKLRKIWRILRNKDFYYSEIVLNKQEWEVYKNWVNRQ